MNLISKMQNSGHEEYTLTENGKTTLKISYRKDLHTARVEIENDKRVLIIENEGLLKPKLLIKNEYGVMMGKMSFDNWSSDHGLVEMENIRYPFTMNRSASSELFFYKKSRRNLVYSCSLSFETTNQPEFSQDSYTYIIATVWYLLQQDVKQVQQVIDGHAYNL